MYSLEEAFTLDFVISKLIRERNQYWFANKFLRFPIFALLRNVRNRFILLVTHFSRMRTQNSFVERKLLSTWINYKYAKLKQHQRKILKKHRRLNYTRSWTQYTSLFQFETGGRWSKKNEERSRGYREETNVGRVEGISSRYAVKLNFMHSRHAAAPVTVALPPLLHTLGTVCSSCQHA